MKKFIIIGAISVGVAVCVLLACASVSTMEKEKKGKGRQMIITLDVETGRVVSVTNENLTPANDLDCRELGKIYQGKDRLKYVGTIVHAHSSPGCIYFTDLLGFVHEICWP